MKNIFKFEWNRMIHSKTFLISAIAASLMIIADVVAWFLLYLQGIDVDTSIFYKWLGVNRGMNAGVYFFIALPLLTAFAYSWSVSYDRNSGYISQIITRTSRKKYFTAKFLVTFISGGIIFAGALILDYVLLAIFSPAYTPIPGDLASSMDPFHFCSEIFYQNPYLFMLIWFGIAFLWGGAMSCISMAAGMLIKKICDLKHCSVSCIYSRANTCIIRYAKIYNYHKRNINWSCLDGYVVCSSYDDIVSGTYSAMYRSDYHDIHAYLHFTRKKI